MNESTIGKRILARWERQVIKKFSVGVDSTLLGLQDPYYPRSPCRAFPISYRSADSRAEPQRSTPSPSPSGNMPSSSMSNRKTKTPYPMIVSNKISKINGVTRVSPSIVVEKLE